jgi:hypothetical protein
MAVQTTIEAEAHRAMALLRRDRAAGEAAFEALLARPLESPDSPERGWLFFLRGGAFEAAGDPGQAAEDYATAVDLLPPGDRRDAAQSALARVASCRGDTVR